MNDFFEVKSGALRVTDPCYDLTTWCSGTLQNVKNGKWFVSVDYYKEHAIWDISEADIHARYNKEIETYNRLISASKEQDSQDTPDVVKGLKKEISVELIESLCEFSAAQRDRDLEHLRNHKGRVSKIKITHEDHLKDSDSIFELANIDVGVDSGQCGFFDLDFFTEIQSKSEEEVREIYLQWCDLTDTDQYAVLENFAFSRSGFGDGSYECFFRKNSEGQTVEAYIKFIDTNED